MLLNLLRSQLGSLDWRHRMNLITQHLTAAPAHRDSREGGSVTGSLSWGRAVTLQIVIWACHYEYRHV